MANKKRRNIQHDSSARHARDRQKQQQFFARYGSGPKALKDLTLNRVSNFHMQELNARAMMAKTKQLFDAISTKVVEPNIWKEYHQKWEEVMKQTWVIDGEWSEYHQHMAKQDGWVLSHVKGMWEIVSTDPKRYPTDDDARQHVLAHEYDPDNSLYMLAVNAIIMGNMGKRGD